MQKTTKNAKETKALAKALLKEYPNVKWWLLYGDLGAGKTTFVKGLASVLKIKESDIKSPTFTLLQDHGALVHADLYRLSTADFSIEEELGEHAAAQKIIVVEWPERLSQLPSAPILRLNFTHQGQNKRLIEVNLQGSL